MKLSSLYSKKKNYLKEGIKAKGLKGDYQTEQYTHYGSFRRKKKEGAERLFKEIMARNVPNLGKESDNQILKAK